MLKVAISDSMLNPRIRLHGTKSYRFSARTASGNDATLGMVNASLLHMGIRHDRINCAGGGYRSGSRYRISTKGGTLRVTALDIHYGSGRISL